MDEQRQSRRSVALTPETWRHDLLRIVLAIFVGLGSIIFIPSVLVAFHAGLHAIVAIDTIAFGLLVALWALRRLPYAVRVAGICLVLYALGAGLLVWVGAISMTYLCGCSLLATMLGGLRWGIASVVLNALTMLVIGYFDKVGVDMAHVATSFAGWTVITINFAFLNALLSLGLGAVIGTLENALGRTSVERTKLHALNTSLADEIREKTLAETSLRENRALLRIAGLTARIGGWRLANHSTRLEWSDEVCELHGVPLGTMPTIEEVLLYHTSENREPLTRAVQGCRLEGVPFDIESQIVTPAGVRKWVRLIGSAAYDEAGVMTHVHGSVQDITDRKGADVQREKLEAQLRQAQKMDAIGRLAGGVAHDFNNLLSVIAMNADMVLRSLPADDKRRQDVLEIIEAGRRSADLTRQLLGFARRQAIAPKPLDLNETIENMLKMLRRLIGEDIELSWRPSSKLGVVKMDESQVDQVLANLVVNARDAIAGVGRVVIETKNVVIEPTHGDAPAGRYVRLSVTDTGSGMDAATQAMLFEPFFTTKAVGKGSGLGLATVYGIVEQNGGFITVESELGRGSTFHIHLLQASNDDLADAARSSGSHPIVVPRGRETVLLVEDDLSILRLVQRLIDGLGYTVIAASSPRDALALAAAYPKIDLLMTDVIMPQMNGREVFEQMQVKHPTMKCLFMSGYTADVISVRGVRAADVHFLQKPFSREALAQGLRAALAPGA